jgi:catechol 2,3-dioxygenase-like lactoylglutathione lyase family enzyme
MNVSGFDHIVLCVRDLERTLSVDFRDPDGNLVEVSNRL